jgi:mannose-6-phosphate isomerase
MTEKLPRKTEKPWGFELLFALTPNYAGKLIFVKKEHRLSLQYHQKKDETLYLHQGKVRLDIEEAGRMVSKTLLPGQSVRVTPGTRHRLEAIEDTTLFEVSTPELDDVVRLEDDYGRADQSD